MKLRDHPLMSYRGFKNWPPVWTQPGKEDVKNLTGEVGVLVYVHANPLMSSKCFLVIDHRGENYVGTLTFDRRATCKHISQFLTLHLKRPIKEIGELDLPDPL